MTEIDAVVRAVTPHRGQRGRFGCSCCRRRPASIRQRVEAVAQRERIGVGDGRVGNLDPAEQVRPLLHDVKRVEDARGDRIAVLVADERLAEIADPFQRGGDRQQLRRVLVVAQPWCGEKKNSLSRRIGRRSSRRRRSRNSRLGIPCALFESCSRRARGASCKRPARERRSCRTSCFGRVRHGPGDGRGSNLGKRRAQTSVSRIAGEQRQRFSDTSDLPSCAEPDYAENMPRGRSLPRRSSHLDHGERRRDGSHIRPNAWSRSNRLSVEAG